MIDSILLNAISWARSAGAIQLRSFRSHSHDIATKINESDIVTEVDIRCDNFLKSSISALYPGHAILTEESGLVGAPDAEFKWIIDPLDGTTNYSVGLPRFAVSIAVYRHGEPLIGVVFAPALDEVFHAVKGSGAFLNGEPIAPAQTASLDQAVVATGFPVYKAETADNNLEQFARVMPRVRGIRTLGCAALDLSYVAAGFLDAYWEANLHEWDVAAGRLIATEAGAIVSDYRTDRNVSVLAASTSIYDPISKLII